MLTDVQARRIRPEDKPISVGGVPGLFLRAGSRPGRGNFILRFVSPETRKRRDMGLGSYPDLGLQAARKLALEAREALAQGKDPLAEKRRQEEAFAAIGVIPTFSDAAHRTYQSLAPSFRNKKHRDQWINTLETYVFPIIGNKKVVELTTAAFAETLRPIWLEKPETAGRVKQRCEAVMNWCLAHGHIDANQVPSVQALLPKQPSKSARVKHHPAVPWEEVPQLIEMLSTKAPTTARDALAFLILTAARSGEVRGAIWEEIDLEKKLWVVPAERMKAKRAHVVPLSEKAMEILARRQELCSDSRLVFPSRSDRPMSDMTITKILRDAKVGSDTQGRFATAHGFRSSFRDWAADHGYDSDLAEFALAHTLSSSTKAAYFRTDLREKRRVMMEDWAAHVMAASGRQ